MKRKGPDLFYYVDDCDSKTIIKETKKIIASSLGRHIIFEVYGLYNGMIDFTPYLSQEKKNESQYYNRTKKDLSKEEVEIWKKEMNI